MRSSVLNAALAVSLESAGVDGEEINPVTSETVVELDEVLEEVREAGETVAGEEDAVDVISEAADSMESLIASLEAAVAAGGMSPQTADMYGRGLANAVRKLPIDKSQFSVSTESFGGTADKLVASQEALEGAKELLSKLWEGIKKAVLNAWNAVKGFYERIGKSGPAVVAAGKSLKSAAGQVKGTPGEKITVGGGALAALSVGGTFDPVKALGAVVEGYDVGVKNYGSKILSSLSPLIATVESGQVSPQRLNEAAAKVDLKAALSDSMQGKLPNGYFFDLTLPEGYVNGSADLAVLSKTSLKLSKGEAKKPASAEIGHPSSSDIAALADKVIAIGNAMIAAKSVMGMAEKGVNAIVKAGTKLAGQGGTLDKEELAGAKAVMAQLNKASRLLTGCGPQYLQYMGSTAKAAVSFGHSVLKGHKVAKEEPAKKD